MLTAPARIAAILAGALAAAGGLVSAPKQDVITPHPRATVVLVTVDTLRFDRATSGAIMPWLTGATREGVLFSRVHSQVPLTLPAHATILTGVGVQRHGVRDNLGYSLPRDVPTVAERFASGGWRTGAFIGGYPLTRAFGVGRGFATFDDTLTSAPLGSETGHVERPAGAVVDAALRWFRAEPDRAALLWVHLYDPHEPYAAPPAFAGRHASPYDGEAAYVDSELGRLVAAIRAASSEIPVWFVIVSDHGEALGAKGELTHGVFLYEEVLHVPLVVLPPRPTAGRVVGEAASLLDVAPTLTALAGLAAPVGAEGRSLLPLVRGEAIPEAKAAPALYLESVHPRRRYGWAPLEGVIDDARKYVAAPRPELYDLRADPTESRNIFDPREERVWRRRLAEARGALRTAADPASGADLERIAGLGYVGGTAQPAHEEALRDRPRPDPKDRVSALPHLERGLAEARSGRFDEARRSLEKALARDPENLVVLNNLGILALRRGDPRAAAEHFRRGLRADPFAEKLANDLGLALAKLGRHEEAAAAYRRALGIAPSFGAARFNLAIALHRLGRATEALRELDRLARENPSFPDLAATRRAIATSRDEPDAQRP